MPDADLKDVPHSAKLKAKFEVTKSGTEFDSVLQDLIDHDTKLRESSAVAVSAENPAI